jgi:hypothetical protein
MTKNSLKSIYPNESLNQTNDYLTQGFSGSQVTRNGEFLIKLTSDEYFSKSKERQNALMALTKQLSILPTIYEINESQIKMEFISGFEGITVENALQTGLNLKLLHTQTCYPFPISTGTEWLREKAIQAAPIKAKDTSAIDFKTFESNLVLIHGEPTQVINRPNGEVVFIDIEGIGMGSRYHDLGFVYYNASLGGEMSIFSNLIEGYGKDGIDISKVMQFAGLISLAYSTFADSEKRIELGCALLQKS